MLILGFAELKTGHDHHLPTPDGFKTIEFEHVGSLKYDVPIFRCNKKIPFIS